MYSAWPNACKQNIRGENTRVWEDYIKKLKNKPFWLQNECNNQ